MSRWIDNFKNHSFQSTWSQIKIQSESLVANDETIVTSIEEIARLRKVIAFLDELLEVVDAEIVPLNIWNQFYDQANACLNQINNYLSNKNIGHINGANEHLDNLLSYLKPYVVNSKGAAVAAGRAYNTYASTVSNQLRLIENKIKSVVKLIEDNKVVTDTIIGEINSSKNNIKELEADFLVGEGEIPPLKEKMESLFSEATSWHSKIKDFHQKLTAGNEQESAIILQIEDAKKKAVSDRNDVKEAKDSIGDLLADLGKFYVTIFGKEVESGGREGGLKQELELKESELEGYKIKQQEVYKTLHGEIESLLPGATSAGLASAYRELKESFDKPIAHYSKLFYYSLAGIFIASFVVITKSIGFWNIEFVDLTDPQHLLNNLIYKLPIILPLLWLAIFASKRRSEDRRLQQEYAHKEALAKSYQSFKKQIESLNVQDDALMKMLLDKAIIAVAFNASTTLDGKHGDKVPFVGALETIAEKLTEKGILDVNPLSKK